jgi:hypothetical protein
VRDFVQKAWLGRAPALSLSQGAEWQVSLVAVMGAASKREILDARRTSACKREDVMELQASDLGAPAA